MPFPVNIFIGGTELLGWTSMSLSREKKNMTGSLTVDIFFTYMPKAPVVVGASEGKDVTVYIGGNLAFTGKLDKRTGKGQKGGGEKDGSGDSGSEAATISSSITASSYTVTLTARGKTKYLIGSSQQHPTTNMLQPTNKQVVEKLLEPFKVGIDWMASTIKLDKARFRDGARVLDELQRVSTENAHFMYETVDGKLRVTDDVGPGMGEALILGENILSFSAEQSEEESRSEVKVKGQRSKKDLWGEKALTKTFKTVKDSVVSSFAPSIVQHYGDATDEALERRGQFEMNKRNADSKELTVDVFHVQSRSGEPWDIGTQHYCEVPPEGIFDVFECTKLTYTVDADKTLKTTLSLSPPPTNSSGGAGGMSGLASFGSKIADLVSHGAARKAQLGIITTPGDYPAPWSGPNLSVLPIATSVIEAAASAAITGLQAVGSDATAPPPLKLPPGYGEDS